MARRFTSYKEAKATGESRASFLQSVGAAVAPTFVKRSSARGTMTRSINQEGLQLIKDFEGLELEAYLDPVGIWTIGYGHIKTAREGMVITADEAEALLLEEIQEYEHGVDQMTRDLNLNDNEFSALVSFAYNVGINALRGSTAMKRLRQGDKLGAAEALTWWNKGRVNGELVELRGLTRRRAAEKALFLKPVVTVSNVPTPRQKPEIVEQRPITDAITRGTDRDLDPDAGPDAGPRPAAETSPAYDVDEDTRLSPEEDTPRRPNLAGSRTMQGAGTAGVAGGAGAAGMVAENMDVEAIQNGPLRTVMQWFESLPDWFVYVMFAIIILAVIYIIWARIDDWNDYKR